MYHLCSCVYRYHTLLNCSHLLTKSGISQVAEFLTIVSILDIDTLLNIVYNIYFMNILPILLQVLNVLT